MALYAKVRNSTNSIEDRLQLDSFDKDAVSHKFGPDKEFRIIPINRLADPVYDSATQRLVGDTITVLPDEVTVQRAVQAIPQTEIDAQAERTQAISVLTDMKNGVGTAEERLQRVEKVLFRVTKDYLTGG